MCQFTASRQSSRSRERRQQPTLITTLQLNRVDYNLSAIVASFKRLIDSFIPTGYISSCILIPHCPC